MFSRFLLATLIVLIAVRVSPGQNQPAKADAKATPAAKSPVGNGNITPLEPVGGAARGPLVRVTKGTGQLPNSHGQFWREYDISPYTLRVTTTKKPEQALIDWILRETGHEIWHGEPLGILSATKRTLRVYHTAEVHDVIYDIVARFVNSEAETHAFSLRILTVGNPNWRNKAFGMMQPVEVQTPGVQAWLMAKEDAALLLAGLRKRNDVREHGSPHVLVNNGQSAISSSWRTRSYTKNIIARTEGGRTVLVPQKAQIDEGFSLEFTPLLSIDGRFIEADIKTSIDQVEKMIPVVIDVPLGPTQRQRFKIEVPQMTSARMHERFRWPVDKVLVISRGVVATPTVGKISNPLNLPLLSPSGPGRADAVVFVQSKGKLKTASTPRRRRSASGYRRRF
ncbi:MAG: hypothetical protein IID44_09745 [Planctomycetes bacterium]|nr:hypothetical protein [Planctomycetota bacterium]